MIEDIFNFTARAFQIPAVLIGGKVEAVGDANSRFLMNCIDPICDQLQEEITRKRYGFDDWKMEITSVWIPPASSISICLKMQLMWRSW